MHNLYRGFVGKIIPAALKTLSAESRADVEKWFISLARPSFLTRSTRGFEFKYYKGTGNSRIFKKRSNFFHYSTRVSRLNFIRSAAAFRAPPARAVQQHKVACHCLPYFVVRTHSRRSGHCRARLHRRVLQRMPNFVRYGNSIAIIISEIVLSMNNSIRRQEVSAKLSPRSALRV